MALTKKRVLLTTLSSQIPTQANETGGGAQAAPHTPYLYVRELKTQAKVRTKGAAAYTFGYVVFSSHSGRNILKFS